MDYVKNLQGLAYANGYETLKCKGTAIVWMSAGNSYFTQDVVNKLLQHGTGAFAQVIVMAPDLPAEHTFRALGYDQKDAKKKARLNANLLQNRAKRAADGRSDSCRIVEWKEEVENNSDYKKRFREILELYRKNPQFGNDARETTKAVLSSKTKHAITPEALEEGVHYLLKELAFVWASPQIYSCAAIAYVYHKPWPIYEKFVAGEYDGIPKKELGLVLIS